MLLGDRDWPLVFLGLTLVTRSSAACLCDELPLLEHSDKIADRYLVTYTNDSSVENIPDGVTSEQWGISQLSKLRTCTINLTEGTLANTRSACNVAYIETDAIGAFDYDTDPDGVVATGLSRRWAQESASWPLVAISQPEPGGKSIRQIWDDMNADPTYYYARDAGAGVDVYVLDTGVNHLGEFIDMSDPYQADRLLDELDHSDEGTFEDTGEPPYGHGTAVAAAIGGIAAGVAKRVTINSVKWTENGEPNLSRFVQVIRHIIEQHEWNMANVPGTKGAIINLSVSFPESSPAGTLALNDAYDAGISIVASGGNGGNEPNRWPCALSKVICVGAATKDFIPWRRDRRWGSNWSPVNIWAPGQDVPRLSANGEWYTADGTSIAAGYVTGTLAIFYSMEAGMTPYRAWQLLLEQASPLMTFPPIAGVNWGRPTKKFLNTGFRKGQRQSPKRAYLYGPEYDADGEY